MKNLMTKTLKTLAVAGITTAVVGAAAPALAGGGGIYSVTAQQRYPWNGKVDISYNAISVEYYANKAGFIPTLKVAAIDKSTTPWTTNVASAANLAGDTSLAEGTHKVVWDLDAEGLSLKSTNVVFTVSSETNHLLYCVIDLSGGPTATKYPVSYTGAPPEDGWNQDVYKTSKLVLRGISAGSVVTNTTTQAKITIDKPYYAGIFPVTGIQYTNVVNVESPCGSTGGKAPVENVSWNTIMSADGFISNLVTKAGVGFDLPTEEQWEYACRAGTSTTYNYGDDADGGYMWYSSNASKATHEVGTASGEMTKGGNVWGLYDMHGNVWEWTLTLYNAGGNRVRRGGSWNLAVDSCTSSYRGSRKPDSPSNTLGFRLFKNLQGDSSDDSRPQYTSESGAVRVDLPTGTRIAQATETIVYSPEWVECTGVPSVTVLIDGETLVKPTEFAGTYSWTPTKAGLNTLKHQIKVSGELKDEQTATFNVPAKVTVTDVANATWVAYTNDVPLTGEQPYTVEGNSIVKVVYEAAGGKMFPGGYKTFTTNVTASATEMTVTLATEQQPRPAEANPNCLTFSADKPFGIKMRKTDTPPTVNLEYSTNQIYWETFNKDDGAAANTDHKLYLRGSGNTAFASQNSQYSFTNTSDSAATAIACSGNVETLLDYQTVATDDHPKMKKYAFSNLFHNFVALTAAPELPATNLTQYCYLRMFRGTSLTAAPKLPAKTLQSSCYRYMFSSCMSLTAVPDLPATTLANYCYSQMFSGCTSLIVNTNAPGKEWSIPAEAASSAASSSNWNTDMFKGTFGNITNEAVRCGVTYYVRSAMVPVTVVLPEVAGATAQLYTFYTKGGWASVATNEVPSNATVRVVWTAEDGKALSGKDATGVFVWQTEFVADQAVQEAPKPEVVEAGESSVTLDIDTRTTKRYFEKEDILPVWYAAGAAEVKVKGEGEPSWTSLVKNAANTNTVSWVPAEQDTYTLTQSGFGDATITLTTPVEVTTNDLEVAGTTVEVTADGASVPEDGIIPSNSVVTVTWTATGSGVYFMDGNTTYTQTFEAGKAVNPVSENVTKPEVPAEPKLLLGVVAQRYPWDGKVDVQYWAKNTPNEGYEITVTVTLPNGAEASETYDCKNGKNAVAFDARAKFGEVQFPKGVKVKATLIPQVGMRFR